MEKLTKRKNFKKTLDKNGHKKKINLLLNDNLFLDNKNFLLRLLKKSQNVPDKNKLMKRVRTSVNRNDNYDDENIVGFNKDKVELTYEIDDLLYGHSKSFSKSKKRYYRIKKENDDFLSFYKFGKNPKIISSNFKKRFNNVSSKKNYYHEIKDEELNNYDVLDKDNFLLMKAQNEIYFHYLFQTLNERRAYTQQDPYKYVNKIKKILRKNSFDKDESEKKNNHIYKEYNKTETNLSYKKDKIKDKIEFVNDNKIKFKNISHQNSKDIIFKKTISDNCKIDSNNKIEEIMKKSINTNIIKENNKNNSNNTITYFKPKNKDENNFHSKKIIKKMDQFKRNVNKKKNNDNANAHDNIGDENNNNIDDNYKSEGEINKTHNKTEINLSSSKINKKIIKINKENIINASNNKPLNIKNIGSFKSYIKPEVNRNIKHTKTISQNKKSIISKLKNKYNFSIKNNFYQNKISNSNIDDQNFDKNKNETLNENNCMNITNTNNKINTYYPNITEVYINKKSTNFTYKNKIKKILTKEGDKNKEKETNEMKDDYFPNNIKKKRFSEVSNRRTIFSLYEEQKNKLNSYNKNNFTNFKTGKKCFDQLDFNNNKDLFNRKEIRIKSSFLTDTNNINFTKIKDINISNYNNEKTLSALMKNLKFKNKDKKWYKFLKNQFYPNKKLKKIEEVNNYLNNFDKCFIKKYSDFQVLISKEDDK